MPPVTGPRWGAVTATSGQGIVHVHHGRTDAFSRLDGLSANEVFRLFEDREGNVWAATYQGLDRFWGNYRWSSVSEQTRFGNGRCFFSAGGKGW